MKLFSIETSQKNHVRAFGNLDSIYFTFELSEFSNTREVHFSIAHQRQELLPGLLIRSRMIHRAHYRGEAHRRNNANKPITSILRNRRARQ